MKLKHIFIPFILALVSGISLRIYQIINGDYKIVSYLCNLENPSFVLILLLAVFVLCIIIMLMIKKNELKCEIIQKNTLVAGLAIASGALVCCEGTINIFEYALGNEDISIVIKGALAVLGGITLLVMGCIYIFGRNLLESARIATLLPVAWSTAYLVIIFYQYASISGSKVDKMELAYAMTLLVFLFANARILSHMSNLQTYVELIASGLALALIVCSYTIPNNIAMIFNQDSINMLDIIKDLTKVSLAGYGLSLAVLAIKNRGIVRVNGNDMRDINAV